MREQKLQCQSLIVEDLKRKKQRQLVLTTGLNQQNSDVGNLTSKAKSLILQTNPRDAMRRTGEVEDAEGIDELITSASITGRPIPDCDNLDFKIVQAES